MASEHSFIEKVVDSIRNESLVESAIQLLCSMNRTMLELQCFGIEWITVQMNYKSV